ncbi:hypothetical protein B0T14DRAFT_257831 [Immersiella caudata]|uniref:Uncharacterized protein n=1 Tax=Immersiella caudata TaxID=314043 RepID=A0AA39WKI8_9PEZI|nr:hypothetical protein B0T14DRAFT_257831 [Immersiella caudata]
MPPLQKSYSDQSNRNAKRPQWQRTNSHPNAQPPAPKPLVPVSESTKNKLQAFQFAPPKTILDKIPEPPKSDKENDIAAPPPKATPRAPHAVGNAVTPIARLAWQDLLGVPEEGKMEEDDTSPSERIMWRPDDSNEVSNSSTSPVLGRKGRKRRARSSSPVSSPATTRTPAVNAKLRAPGLHTPRTDPAVELWDRGTTGVMNPLLARMMVSSSPRPPKADGSPVTDRSLRKSISCGSNWPKRRRMEQLDVEHAAKSQDNERPNTKSSLVSALLQTVDGEIRKSNTSIEEEEQTSSPSRRRSPRRSRTDARPVVRPSPIREAPEPDVSEPMRSSSAAVDEPVNNAAQPMTTRAPSDYGDDDFGDDDFDEDTLMELDTIVKQPAHADTTLVAAEESPPTVAASCPPKAIVDDEFDEFGDLDDDLFEGAEGLVAEVESKFVSQAAGQGKQQKELPRTNVGEEEDDPYGLGDDFGDDFDLEAIELAATQSASRASALTHVRSVR